MKKAVNLIFPHQLFSESPLLDNGNEVYLVEEFLFFKQYRFHKQKIAFHRASMKYYQQYMEEKGVTVHYIDTNNILSDITQFHLEIAKNKITTIVYIDPTDRWLEGRIKLLAQNCVLQICTSPQFLNDKNDLSSFFRSDKTSFFQTTFYKQQRIKRNILLDDQQQPQGGKWTYDTENRKKYPKGEMPRNIRLPSASIFWDEAVEYTETHFKENLGQLSEHRSYPITH